MIGRTTKMTNVALRSLSRARKKTSGHEPTNFANILNGKMSKFYSMHQLLLAFIDFLGSSGIRIKQMHY